MGFANYLSAVTVGHLTDNPVVCTICHKLTVFFATWTCCSSVQVSKTVRQQVYTYFQLSKFKSTVTLEGVHLPALGREHTKGGGKAEDRIVEDRKRKDNW
jgi:hypothetical protein